MRLLMLTLAAALVSGPAWAQTPQVAAPAVLEQVYGCAEVADAAERLACYDGAVGRLRQAESAGQFVAVDRAQAEELQRDAFGFSLPSIPRLLNFGADQPEVEDISAVISRVGGRADGRQIYYLDNGHAWLQVDGDNHRARAGAAVTIRRASLGSFMMSFGGGAAIRVRRQE